VKFFTSKYFSLSDEELIECFKKEDKKAFDEIYRRYHSKLLKFFYRMLSGDYDQSKDLTQEVFIKVFFKKYTFDSSKSFSTWIYKIATNICFNEFRRIKVQTQSFYRINYQPDLVDNDQEMDNEMINSDVNKYLEELDYEHRTCLLLRYNDELSVKEIAEIMNCPEGTVKSRLYYTIKYLSERLKKYKDI